MIQPSPQRGSVVLVGLMLTVVLGIVLTSYIALCTNALRLSHREYQSNRALQLAENGMDEALWALGKFKQNPATGFIDGTLSGATIDWSPDSSTGIRAATISGFSTAGEGSVTQKIGIRVLNYKDPTAPVSAWSAGTTYAIGDYAIIGGTTYCCATSNSGHSPAPSTATDWNVGTTYALNDYVKRGGTLYRCKAANTTGQPPENAGYWTPFWTTGQIINTEGLVTFADGSQVRRQLLAVFTPSRSLFSNAIAAVNGGSVSLSNYGGTIDSYDSTIAAYVPGSGQYSAIVAGTTIDINSATVKGYTATTGSAVDFRSGSDILAPGQVTGRNPSRILINNSMQAPLVGAPSTPSPITIHDWGAPISDSFGDPITTLTSGTYRVGTDLHLGTTGTLTIDGAVKLIVEGNLFIGIESSIDAYRLFEYSVGFDAGSDGITVNNGASLEIYVSGHFGIYAGGIKNLNSKPSSVSIYCSSSSSSCDIRTATPFYGTIYAPKATVTIHNDAGIAPDANFFGAVVAKHISLQEGASLHYDMALRNAPNLSPNLPHYRSIIVWRELANPSEPEFVTFNYP